MEKIEFNFPKTKTTVSKTPAWVLIERKGKTQRRKFYSFCKREEILCNRKKVKERAGVEWPQSFSKRCCFYVQSHWVVIQFCIRVHVSYFVLAKFVYHEQYVCVYKAAAATTPHNNLWISHIFSAWWGHPFIPTTFVISHKWHCRPRYVLSLCYATHAHALYPVHAQFLYYNVMSNVRLLHLLQF